MRLAFELKKHIKKLVYQSIFIKIAFQARLKYHLYKRCIYFIATPIHGNLGDHAIVYAQYKLFEELGLKKNIIEISRPCYEETKEKLQRLIEKNDLIVIDGGGNLGTLWPEEDMKMRDIIQRFCKNPIFIFPQTAYYANTAKGETELQKSIDIYQQHSNLTIFCRDKITYDLVKSRFKGVQSYYTPDMVPFLDNARQERVRNGVLLCFRDDLECTCSTEFKSNLRERIAEMGYVVKITSTVIHKRVTKGKRKRELHAKWKEFSTAGLVITDRLHGMIFSAITGTPCIAIDNISHKIRDGYQWIKYLPYIELYDNCKKDMVKIIDDRMKRDTCYCYDRTPLKSSYEVIMNEIKKAFIITS